MAALAPKSGEFVFEISSTHLFVSVSIVLQTLSLHVPLQFLLHSDAESYFVVPSAVFGLFIEHTLPLHVPLQFLLHSDAESYFVVPSAVFAFKFEPLEPPPDDCVSKNLKIMLTPFLFFP